MSIKALIFTVALVTLQVQGQKPVIKQAPFWSHMGKKVSFLQNAMYGNRAPTLNQICKQIVAVSGTAGLSDGMGKAAKYMDQNRITAVGDPNMKCLLGFSQRARDVENTFGDYFDTVGDLAPFGYDPCGPPSCDPNGIDTPFAIIAQKAAQLKMGGRRAGGMMAGIGSGNTGMGSMMSNMMGNAVSNMMGGGGRRNNPMNPMGRGGMFGMGGGQQQSSNPFMNQRQQPQAAFPVPAQQAPAAQNNLGPKAAPAPAAPVAPAPTQAAPQWNNQQAPAAPTPAAPASFNFNQMISMFQNPQFMQMFMHFLNQNKQQQAPQQRFQQRPVNPFAMNPMANMMNMMG